MKKIFQTFVTIIILFYIIYTPIYLLCFNSAETAAKKMSFISSAEQFFDMGKNADDQYAHNRLKIAQTNLNKISDTLEKNGIDLSKSVYKQLKNDKDVRNVNIKFITKEKQKIDRNNSIDMNLFELSWEKEEKRFRVNIFVVGPSFFLIQTAKAFTPDDILVLSAYNLPQSDLRIISQVMRSF